MTFELNHTAICQNCGDQFEWHDIYSNDSGTVSFGPVNQIVERLTPQTYPDGIHHYVIATLRCPHCHEETWDNVDLPE